MQFHANEGAAVQQQQPVDPYNGLTCKPEITQPNGLLSIPFSSPARNLTKAHTTQSIFSSQRTHYFFL
jgi:hypothetical protein